MQKSTQNPEISEFTKVAPSFVASSKHHSSRFGAFFVTQPEVAS